MDNLYTGQEAKDRLMLGIDKTVDAVKGTLGAKGINALLQTDEYPYTLSTSDGISIIEAIKLEDPIEAMGAALVKENSGRHNKQSGDGSTSAAVLLQAILHEAAKVTDVAPIEIMDSLNAALPAILTAIDEQTKPITVDEVGKIAAIAARDEKIGALIQEIYQQIGKDGILYPDISKTYEDSYTIGKGIKIEGAGFASPYMADLDAEGRFTSNATYKNPKILVTKQKISSPADLEALSSSLYAREIKELVVFCDDIETNVLTPLVMTRAKNGFKFLVIKLPVFWKDQWFEDVAKLTGATIVDPTNGLTFKTVRMEHLGTCANLMATKEDAYLDGVLDVTDYVAGLMATGDDENKIRAARLNTKTARLFVGAHSDAMLSYRRLRVEDARNSAYLALQHGIVAGGGVALFNVAQQMHAEKVGGLILTNALEAPLRQIMTNAGASKGDMEMISGAAGSTIGYDAKLNRFIDMFDAGIVDSAAVVKSSITQALSIASIVLTSPVIITLPKKEPQAPMPYPMR